MPASEKLVSARQWPLLAALLVLLLPAPLRAQIFPWPDGEKLLAEILWPSGVSMGEATLEARSLQDRIHLTAHVEVALPQGRLLYRYSSTATAGLCSLEFRRSSQRSGKFWEEITRFDPETGMASVTRDGHTREAASGKCPRDPLTYLYYYRAQAAAGKRPTTETLFLNGALPLRIESNRRESVKVNRIERQGERYRITFPSAAGEGNVEIWLDGATRQTPIAVRLPLPLATFSAELR